MYQVDIEDSGNYLFKVSSEGYKFCIDAKGKGVSPPAALLASLGSCVGVYLKKYAEGAKLNFDGFKITAKAEFSKEKPVGFRDIYIAIDLNRTHINQRRKRAIISFIKNCPVHNTLKADPNVSMEIV